MPRNWNSIAESTEGDYEVADFQRALYQLNAEQCLYARFSNQAVAYRLISRFRDEFAEAAALFGSVLEFNDRHEYCYVVNSVARLTQLPLEDTLFILTLRFGYHAKASVGDLDEFGVATIDLPEFAEMHKAVTGREVDMRRARLEELLSVAKRSGLAMKIDADESDDQPFAIAVLPGISDVLGEHVINRFGAELKARIEGSKAAALAAGASPDAKAASAAVAKPHEQMLPFTIRALQDHLFAKHGMSPADTISACQMLYANRGVITYPVTDCAFLPAAYLSVAEQVIGSIAKFSEQLASMAEAADLNMRSAAWVDETNSPHHGIIPTVVINYGAYTMYEQLAFEAICERYLAQFQPQEQTATGV